MRGTIYGQAGPDSVQPDLPVVVPIHRQGFGLYDLLCSLQTRRTKPFYDSMTEQKMMKYS